MEETEAKMEPHQARYNWKHNIDFVGLPDTFNVFVV